MSDSDDKLLKNLSQLKEKQEKAISFLQELREEQTEPEVVKQLDEIERHQWNAIIEIEELRKAIHPFKAQALAIADFKRKTKPHYKQTSLRIDGFEL